MENQTNSKSIIINNGLILGTISVLMSLIMYALGNHLNPHWSLSLVSTIFTIAFIILGIKKYKSINDGLISWGQAVKIGVGITILAALISVIYNYIFISFIEPDFMNQLLEVQNQKMIDGGMSEEQIEAANEMSKKFSSPLITSAIGIIGAAILGFIISAIAGAIMKKTEENDY
ncbi:DUF4199 domain-containing protein [uncultured Tenacibaculum sp.]|uniref:DUF4199 domain-containing protein n=1 Tax=uncultured Tenacibaculum sp. TaxID=174713 RepID=UPI00260E47E8|nr:DUF4199 domain-containing protein [uncultured Tenacibaculum sp.]